MKPAAFDYISPETLDEALSLLDEHAAAEPKLLAGGQSLIPMMNFRVAQPAVLIDLNRVPGLAFVDEHEGHIAIGAMTRHNVVKAHPLVARHLPLIRAAYEHVAHGTIRNRGTLGGNLVHADPASEMPAAMLALEARLVLQSSKGTRVVEAADFFLSTYTTATEPDEILVEILVPKQSKDERFAFEEASLRKGDFAMSAVAAVLTMTGKHCIQARLSLAGVSDTPVRATAAEAVLEGQTLDEAIIAQAADATVAAIDFIGTVTVSAGYRRDLTHALIRRALTTIGAGAAKAPL